METRIIRLLSLRCIFEAPQYNRDLLEKIDTATDEDRENFTSDDWKWYAQGAWDRYLLPEFGPPRYYSDSRRPGIVVPIAGRRFRVQVVSRDYDDPSSPEGRELQLFETDDPETVPDCDPPPRGYRGHHYIQAFGQPNWIQNESYPADPRGNPCRHLLTAENSWGDCGNWNILVGVDEEGLPDIAYFEASCC